MTGEAILGFFFFLSFLRVSSDPDFSLSEDTTIGDICTSSSVMTSGVEGTLDDDDGASVCIGSSEDAGGDSEDSSSDSSTSSRVLFPLDFLATLGGVTSLGGAAFLAEMTLGGRLLDGVGCLEDIVC